MLQEQNKLRILLTGASGYVGSHLLKKLKEEEIWVRCLVRDRELMEEEADDIVVSELLIDAQLDEKLKGIDQVFYLVHSLDSKRYEETDRIIAERFGMACQKAGIKRIIYLGGLSHPDYPLSTHLKSRQETGRVLMQAAPDVQVIELRASVIIGPGSISFEMICALTERLPVMIIPKWVKTPLQPISIGEVIEYLYQSLFLPIGPSKIYEIGGNEVTSYEKLMIEYAKMRGLKRFMIPVPVLTPFLSSLWLAFVTPLYANIGRNLIESAAIPTVLSDFKSREDFNVHPLSSDDALREAVKNEDKEVGLFSWGKHRKIGNYLVDARSIEVALPPDKAFKPILQIGGNRGWYFADVLWEIRGLIDRMVGGPGLRRGRKDPEAIKEGEHLDFWTVATYIPDHKLTLIAEMRVPGKAFLCFEVVPTKIGSKIYQTAIFRPKGVLGILYWYLLLPIHKIIFKRMLNAIGKWAIENQ